MMRLAFVQTLGKMIRLQEMQIFASKPGRKRESEGYGFESWCWQKSYLLKTVKVILHDYLSKEVVHYVII